MAGGLNLHSHERLKMLNWTWRRELPALGLCLVLLWLQLLPPVVLVPLLERLDGLWYDARLQHLPPWPHSVSNIRIVDIDEASLADIGRMPWDRRHFARLTQQLQQAGALLIVYDILFAEAQANPLQDLMTQWPPWSALTAQQQQEWRQFAGAQDQDQQFSQALQSGEVVLASLLHQYPGKAGASQLPAIHQQRPPGKDAFTAFAGLTAPVPVLAQVAAGQGFMNAEADADGLIRHAALVHQYAGQLYPALALEAFRVYSLLTQIEPVWYAQSGRIWLQGLKLGNSLIQTDERGRILIPYRGGARHYPYTPASDVLHGRIAPGTFAEAVVFVGTSAAGLADLRTTPTAQVFPGVEIHATVFDALMFPDAIPYRPDWWRAALLLQMLVLAGCCLCLFPRLGPLASLMLSLSLFSLIIGLNLGFWIWQVIDLPMLLPCLQLLLLAAFYLSAGFFRENRRRSQMKTVFAQYLPPAHIERLLLNPAAVSLDGEKKLLTVLFSDIRGFTTIAEQLAPQQLKHWLNRVFNVLTAQIHAHDGTIDKYVGDMVMAFWGAPLADAAHGQKAVQAALAMQAALDMLNRQFASEALPLVQIGIGINSGEMNVGDMGSDFRRSYTVIGDAVNLASRLEALTTFYGVPLLVGESTKSLACELQYALVDKVQVKGKQQAVRIYLPLPATLTVSEQAAYQQFNEALRCYFSADFVGAQQLLLKLQASADPVLQRLIAVYLPRISVLLHQAPPPDWDGSFRHQSKS